jgi:hypothetical protein
MSSLLDRLAHEAGLVVLVGLGALLAAIPLVAWRLRSGVTPRRAVTLTALEVALGGAIIGIVALTLGSFAGVGAGQIDLIPFHALIDSFALGEFYVGIAFVDLAANLLLYLPLGLLAGLRWPRSPAWRLVLVAASLSLVIEVTQVLVLNRAGDISDVLMNASGAFVGVLIARTWQRARASARRAV